MTEIVKHTGAALAIAPEQTTFTEQQRTILSHMGVENAPEPDLQVFMHQCQRTGLDPFARQIHMIGRNSFNQRTDQWETKYTIQTGIDGYRVVGHRAAERAGHTVSVLAPQWCDNDGRWRDAWSKSWGAPIAARVTIKRNGEPFTATTNFDEYVQTKKNGQPTQMWTQRGAGQLAKCAEAMAWRMAFPHDLAGVYLDEEMQHADGSGAPLRDGPARRTVTSESFDAPADDTIDAEVEDEPAPAAETGEAASREQIVKIQAQCSDLGLTRPQRLAKAREVAGRHLSSANDLTKAEASRLIEALDSDLAGQTQADDGYPTEEPSAGGEQ